MNTETKTTRIAWLAARRDGIGGSDVGALLGVSRYSSPLSVYCDKAGLTPLEGEQNDAMRLGQLMETANAAMYHEATGETVATGPDAVEAFAERSDACEIYYRDDERAILRSTRWPCLLASLDALAIDERGAKVLEFKNARSVSDWPDLEHGIPEAYYLQVQTYLAVTGLDRAAISVIVSGSQHLHADIERDDAKIEEIAAAAEAMIRRVADEDPPDPEGHDADDKAIQAIADADTTAEAVDLGAEGVDLDLEFEAASEAAKAASKRLKEVKQAIAAKIGGASVAMLPSGVSYTYKAQARNPSLSLTPDQWAEVVAALDVGALGPKLRDKITDTAGKPAASFRVLRRKAAKGAK